MRDTSLDRPTIAFVAHSEAGWLLPRYIGSSQISEAVTVRSLAREHQQSTASFSEIENAVAGSQVLLLGLSNLSCVPNRPEYEAESRAVQTALKLKKPIALFLLSPVNALTMYLEGKGPQAAVALIVTTQYPPSENIRVRFPLATHVNLREVPENIRSSGSFYRAEQEAKFLPANLAEFGRRLVQLADMRG